MMLDLALGDAYGRPFEFNTPEFIKKFNTGKQYLIRSVEETDTLFGTYTDDTQMSIAIAELLFKLDSGIDLEKIAEKFVYTYQRDPHMGYSKRMYAAFNAATGKINPGKVFFNSCMTENIVNSNGSVMRSVPLGVLSNEGAVVRAAQMQSLVTHCSCDASMGSQLIALTSHYFYYRKHGGDLSYKNFEEYMDAFEFFDYMELCLTAFLNRPDQIPCDARTTVGAVLFTLFKAKTTTEILTRSVAYGGDVDSVASITSGLGALKDNIKIDYDKNIILGLENGKYGKDYLCKLDRNILEAFPRD